MRALRARSELGRSWPMELAIRSAFRSLKIVLTKFPWRKHSWITFATRQTSNVKLSFDPFSYQRRVTEKIERGGFRVGGDELIRVVVRRDNFDKIAHKID